MLSRNLVLRFTNSVKNLSGLRPSSVGAFRTDLALGHETFGCEIEAEFLGPNGAGKKHQAFAISQSTGDWRMKHNGEAFMDEDLKKTAIDCVQKGGAVLLDYYNKLQTLQVRSKGRFDYVTEADLAAQEIIVQLIRSRHPEHDILAEEGNSAPGQNASRWLVDPLDGTTNFIHGFPVFAVSVALEHENSIVLGAVYDPCRRELFVAQRGHSATLNGRRIQVSTRRKPDQALIATAFPWREKAIFSRYLEGFIQVFAKVSDIRRGGSAALDLAYVACGRCDGFWELGLSPWDIAAGHLLVREAGGHISDFGGDSNHIWVGDVVAGNQTIHAFLLGIIRGVFGGNVSLKNA